MVEIKRIKMEEQDTLYIQRLHYEVSARTNVINTLLEAHAMDNDDAVLRSKAFKTYASELSSLTAEYEIAKNKLFKKYGIDFAGSETTYWEIDFEESEMVFKG